jgi:DNA recombination protein RmuC
MFIDQFYINFLLGFFSASLMSIVIFWIFYRKLHIKYERVYEFSKRQNGELILYKERLEQIGNFKESLSSEFKDLATLALSKTTKQNSEHIKMTIMPFYENIKNFSDQVKEFYIDESRERYSLQKEIQKLNELNRQISKDAINLTNALKGENKTQGDWGELILARVLESSGLVKDREYTIQKSFKDESNQLFRPDVIVNLPQNREVIIDSKVSLKSYELYFNDELERKNHLLDFIRSIKGHIDSLSKKRYQNLEGIESLDFVLMFIPIEGAFATALSSDSSLYEYAYKKNVILVSPTTLIAVLRVIENSWRVTYQNKNAKIIAKKAGELNDKFKLFVDEMKKVESSLNRAKDSYDEAFKRLSTGRGNLIARSDELRSLQSSDQTKEDSSLSTF